MEIDLWLNSLTTRLKQSERELNGEDFQHGE